MMMELEKWRTGEDLNFACYQFSDSYLADKFRSAPSLPAQDAIKLAMYADLFGYLADGTFEAWGFRTDKKPEEPPQRVPAHFFDERPDFSDCESNAIAVGQWRYERVRICKLDREPLQGGSTPPAVETTVDVSAPASEISARGSTPTKRGGGRSNTYPRSKKVLRKLLSNPTLASLSAERLHPQFCDEFARMFPTSEFKIPPPSVRTLRYQLKLFRQELAKTGRN